MKRDEKRSALTDFQSEILLLASDGLSNREIAKQVSRPFNAIITTFSNIKRKGYQLPAHRPLDATAERALGVQGRREKRDKKWMPSSSPRFTAKGVKASTGERFEVTSDSQAHSDNWLAYMVGAIA